MDIILIVKVRKNNQYLYPNEFEWFGIPNKAHIISRLDPPLEILFS